VCIAAVAVALVKREKPKEGGNPSLSLDQAIEVIKANTEINTRLVSAIEQQTRIINDLAYAVHKLVGHIEGGK
jgi:hypothetical protein